MKKRLTKIKKIRLHREGTNTLVISGVLFVAIAFLLYQYVDNKLPFYIFSITFGITYAIIVNFFRCPVRYFDQDTEDVVVAPADGKIVVVEEVEENEYFHEKRIMVSIFMSLFNVHANWFPVDGRVVSVKHHDGNFHKAWLPKASEENERADTLIETPEGTPILCRQIAGAVARRIVTYAKPQEDCYIDEHLGFIKFGSRVDLFLPLDTELNVAVQDVVRNGITPIAKIK